MNVDDPIRPRLFNTIEKVQSHLYLCVSKSLVPLTFYEPNRIKNNFLCAKFNSLKGPNGQCLYLSAVTWLFTNDFILRIVLSQKEVEIKIQVDVTMKSIGHFRGYQQYGLSFSILITRQFL